MAAKFNADTCTITWHGTDHTTPPGHTIATGRDKLGNVWLWLFKGNQPTDETFVGAVNVPHEAGATSIAYGRGGGFAGVVHDVTDTLAKLASIQPDA